MRFAAGWLVSSLAQVKISVHTKGGMLGLDRVVHVDDTEVTVVEGGSRTRTIRLQREDARRLADIATCVAQMADSPTGPSDPDAVDCGVTEIAIREGALELCVQVPSGGFAPDEVWDLLDLVERAAQA